MHRGWRDRLLLFYGERHLEEKEVARRAGAGSRRSRPVRGVGRRRGRLCGGDDTKRRHIEAALGQDADEPRSRRLHTGIVEGYSADGYDIRYADGPYRREDKTRRRRGIPKRSAGGSRRTSS